MPTMLIRHHALYYQDIGEGFPVLLGHGYLWDRKMWQAQVERLSSQFRCIVPDLWSHGFSEEIPQRPYSIEQLSEDYFHLMRYLGFEQYAIVGHSVGGMWGAQLAINHPEKVKALILLDTFLGEEQEEKKQTYLEYLAMIEAADRFDEHLADTLCHLFFADATHQNNPSLIQKFRSHLMQIPHERLAGLVEIGYTIFNRGSLLGQLQKLEMPVLVACGTEDKPRPVSESKQMLQHIKHRAFHTFKDAGHVVALEQPQHVTDLLEQFLIQHLVEEQTLAIE